MLFSKNLENEMDYTWVKLLRAVTTTYKVGKKITTGLSFKILDEKNLNKKRVLFI